MCSQIVRSDRDETFGFFKRPRKFEIVAAAPEVAEHDDTTQIVSVGR